MARTINETKLSPATLKTLRALWDQPEMKAYYVEFRSLSGVRSKAYYPFVRRLEQANFVVNDQNYYHLTFGGMQALKGHYAALYAARPCEAYRLEMEKFSHFPDRSVA